MILIKQIKQLREQTLASITQCSKALRETKGDLTKAKELLKTYGKDVAQKKAERAVGYGILESYIHPNKKIGAMLELRCESDFVSKSEEFRKLAHELCLQIAAMGKEETPLLKQLWIKDEKKTIQELINEYIIRMGENIEVTKFIRYEI